MFFIKNCTVILAILIGLFSPIRVFAQAEYQQSFFQAIVTGSKEAGGQKVTTVTLITGTEKGRSVDIVQSAVVDSGTSTGSNFQIGDQVVITKIESGSTIEYFISDAYRSDAIVWLGVIYIGAIVVLSKWKGVKSLLGLGISFLTLTGYIIPQILAGQNPVIVTVVGSVVIMTSTLYLAHGFTRQTTVSLLGTLVSLVLASVLAEIMISLARLSGLGTEEAMFLFMGQDQQLNLRGLLLSGMIISCLGVIDDITVTQTAIVYELKNTKANLTIRQLYQKGLSIGKEHISSVTNTLILAYAGASLPLFILFYQSTQMPLWVAINSELVAEEVISTLVGSIGLVMSVPITTYLAAIVVSQNSKKTASEKKSQR